MRQGAARRGTPGLGHNVGPVLDWDAEEDTTSFLRAEDEAPPLRLRLEDDRWASRSRPAPPPIPPEAKRRRSGSARLSVNVQLPASEFGREFGYRRGRPRRTWIWVTLLAGAIAALALHPRIGAQRVIGDLAQRFAARAGLDGFGAHSTAPISPKPAEQANPPAAAAAPAEAAPLVQPVPSAPSGTSTAERRAARRRALRAAHQAQAEFKSEPPSPVPEPVAESPAAPPEPVADSPVGAPPVAESPTSPGGTGVLRINSLPWAEVSIDGDWIGTTPQVEIKLPVGRHRVRLFNPDLNLKRVFYVDIAPGTTLTKSVQLQ